MNDERSSNLNRRLRAGDPFAGEPGMTSEEVRAMRRTVLTALPEPRRRLLPALTLAGAAAVALLIAVIALWPGSGGPPQPQPPRIAVAPMPSHSREPVALAPILATARPLLPEKRMPHLRHPRRPPAEETPAGETPSTNATLATLDPAGRQGETAIREIQFSTPGGTRIIWTLAPGKTSF
jgi:hypothetical protein